LLKIKNDLTHSHFSSMQVGRMKHSPWKASIFP